MKRTFLGVLWEESGLAALSRGLKEFFSEKELDTPIGWETGEDEDEGLLPGEEYEVSREIRQRAVAQLADVRHQNE